MKRLLWLRMSRLVRSSRIWIPFFILCSLIGPHCAALPQTEDQAERLFDNATTFMSAGKYKEALADLESIINNYGATATAPRALLEIGTYYLDVQQDYVKALDYFSQIQSRYPSSSAAPAAYYYKAQIVEHQGQTPAQLEEAVADLIRMTNLYPDNSWRTEANFLFGKLNLRLNDYDLSLSYFQRLEFFFSKSRFIPRALLLSAKAAYLRGNPRQSELILARLQANFPTSEEADFAGQLMRLLHRFTGDAYPGLQLDQSFYGATPKKFSNPSAVVVDYANLVGIGDSKGAHFVHIGGNGNAPGAVSTRDLVDFCRDRQGNLLLVYKNQILDAQRQVKYASLSGNGTTLRDIRGVAVDAYGRLLVVDDDVKDVWAFSRDGQYLKSFGLNRPRKVRVFEDDIWVLNGDDDTFSRFDANFARRALPGLGQMRDIEDFDFDPFGNLYILSDKGNQLNILTRNGRAVSTVNLKNGTYPLKQAEAIAVDASGAVYLADRRGGAVYRFQ
ncbi:Uncharacterized protein YjiK [Sulfidibacter corallicola]